MKYPQERLIEFEESSKKASSYPQYWQIVSGGDSEKMNLEKHRFSVISFRIGDIFEIIVFRSFGEIILPHKDDIRLLSPTFG